ncbi:MAG: YegS/Rv2252/BmrU family lipid kinase [Lachnospiraceae bacterium]|nr:YegS/Rv2252/BmrU family lipid kinase [Lachnospiraceae bacterium]
MNRKKQMLLIVNPKSGKAQIRTKLLDILDLFGAAGYQVQVHITQKALDARETVVREGARKDLIVCSGGDGTLNETISGMMQLKNPPQLGYIPAGSTNDFASSLKIPKQMLTAARAVVSGSGYPIDIGRFCGDRYFVYVAGFGAFTEVSYLTPQDKKNVLGHQAYMLESVRSLASIKSYSMQISWEDQVLEGEFIFGMITNTISVGGFKGLVDQNAALNDGLFEVLLIRTPKTPVEFSSIVTSLFLKEEQANDLVYRFKTSSLQIQSQEPVDWVLDGEFGGSRTGVEIENLCQTLEIRRNS